MMMAVMFGDLSGVRGGGRCEPGQHLLTGEADTTSRGPRCLEGAGLVSPADGGEGNSELVSDLLEGEEGVEGDQFHVVLLRSERFSLALQRSEGFKDY